MSGYAVGDAVEFWDAGRWHAGTVIGLEPRRGKPGYRVQGVALRENRPDDPTWLPPSGAVWMYEPHMRRRES